MKATRSYKNLTIDVEASDSVKLWDEIAAVDEVFGNDTCGKCDSEDIRFHVRLNAKKHRFYELHCQNCRAKKMFGQHQDNPTLFPQRKQTVDGEEQYLPDDGWVHYDKEKDMYI